MVTKEDDGSRVIDWRIFANEMIKKDCCHRRDVFMTESKVRASKTCVAGLDRWSNGVGLCRFRGSPLCLSAVIHVACKYFFRNRHRPRPSLNWRQQHSALHSRHVELKQSAT